MKKDTQTKKINKPLLITSILVVITIAATLWYVFMYNAQPKVSTAVKKENENNAKTIEAEKDSEALVISDEVKVDDTPASQEDINATPAPTYDAYGPSTKNDRPDVHAVNLAVSSIYRDYLYKLQTTPQAQRQAVADQYIVDNSPYFSPTFNYLSSDSLHLFPQNASLSLPTSTRINSSIVDPEDPNQVIVQIVMEPNVQWSILVVVKKKDSLGNFGTFEKLIPRMNLNPL